MKKLKILVIVIGVIYLIFPFIAGILQLGDRDVPQIYSRGHHSSLYIIGHEMGNGGIKPRSSVLWMFTNRPFFYGMKRQVKPSEAAARVEPFINDTEGLFGG